MNEVGKRTTILDVARAAGVSKSTVSRVVNHCKSVRPEVAQRVREVMGQMGYTPNIAAASLRTSRTLTVGLILPDIRNPFYADLARGVEDYFRRHNYMVLLANAEHESERVRAFVQKMHERGAEGVLLTGSNLERDDLGLFTSLPAVFIEEPPFEQNRIPVVKTDNCYGGYLATRHLIELGHRRIAYVGGMYKASDERYKGYLRALSEYGIEERKEYVVFGAFTLETGFSAVNTLWSLAETPTAVFGGNDLIAAGVMRGLLLAGLRVPDDVSVVGFDGSLVSQLTTPLLTTVVQATYDLGVAGASLLLRMLKGKAVKMRPRTLKPKLRIGGSTGTIPQ